MATKGQKFKQWTAEEKYKIIEPILNMEKSISEISVEYKLSSGMIANWRKAYDINGMNGLKSKRKPGNPLCKYSNKKNLSDIEKLEYENMKLKIENELLKKGMKMEGDGTIVKHMK